MSASMDKDPAEEGEDARGVLASWLDDYASGRCDRADMQESFLSVCRSNPDAPWDALALLDQYQRRGKIDAELARSLKTDIAQLVFGVASQTEETRDTTEATLDTTGSRWRKLLAERDPESINAAPSAPPPVVEQPFADPTSFRREAGPTTRPPALKHSEPPAAARKGVTSDVLRDRYELLSVLGRGSAGTVYRALDRHRAHLSESARCVAVKVLKANYQDRLTALAELEREFHQAQSMSHPNIVSVFDLDRDGDTYFIVMELLEGELLADVLHDLDGRPMAREHALGLISSIGAALAYAHRRDIVHADLKPRNVMITKHGEVRVLDFGFARNRPLELHSASALHEVSVPAPAYASVERVNGSEPHPSDDVYSLACIAYELLSGQHPFGGRSAVLARAHGRHPRRISGLSHKQSSALQRALLWTRGERKIDVVELLAGLGCADAPIHLVPPDELSVPASDGAGRLRMVALLAFLLALIVGGAYLFSRLESLEPPANVAPVSPAQPDREVPPTADPSVAQEAKPSTNASVTRTEVVQPERIAPSAPSSSKPAISATPAASTPARPGAAAVPAANAPQTSAAARPITIEFDKDTYVATESDGSVRLVIRRSGSTRQAAAFRWKLRGNSAEPGADFAGIGPDVEQIPAGAREVAVTIPLVSDGVVENTELFLVEIEPAQDGVTLGERSHAAVIIVDDD
jgi:serine/threonine protein kinase